MGVKVNIKQKRPNLKKIHPLSIFAPKLLFDEDFHKKTL
jgi:hypothetical protein